MFTKPEKAPGDSPTGKLIIIRNKDIIQIIVNKILKFLHTKDNSFFINNHFTLRIDDVNCN